MRVDVFAGKSCPAGRTDSFALKVPLLPPDHRSNLSVLRAHEARREEAPRGPSRAILVTSVNSPIFQSGVISTFDMLVFL